MGNLVAIIGRPNVGKSTLFNRLTQTRQAIVNEESGVTRDRHYGKCEWNGREFSVVDTGGLISGSEDIFEKEIARQVHIAIEESDLLIFVVDVMNGVTDLDQEVARIVRKTKKPFLLVVNKVDNHELFYSSSEFYSLGFEQMYCISSINGSGTGELLDAVVESLNPEKDREEDELPRLSIVGRPNVGKSSITNAFLDDERNIVTDISGTTRDSIESKFNKFGFEFKLVDTAGLRKRNRVDDDVEFYSTMRSIRAIEMSDVCLLVIDAERGVEQQELNILRVILKNSKGLVVLVNKWDKVEKETNTVKEITEEIKKRFAPFTDFPVIFTSAITKQRILKALEEAIRVYHNKSTRISTSKLNSVMLDCIEAYSPPSYKGKYIKIKYVTQLPSRKMAFAFYCNLPQYIKDPYKRYLENKLREYFDLEGVPFEIYFRKK
jgi:GTP-binding protein